MDEKAQSTSVDRVIWKFGVLPKRSTEIRVTEGAKFLSVAMQGSEMMLWVEVNPHAKRVPAIIYVVPTGMLFDVREGKFVGTVQPTPELVFHIYVEEIS